MKQSKKKILLLATKGDMGGVQVFMLNLALQLKKQGLNVSFGFGEGEYLAKEARASSIPFYQFKYLQRTHNPLKNILFIFEFKRCLKKEKFTVIHINSSNALLGALAARWCKHRPKTVFTVHGLSLVDEEYQKNKILKKFYTAYFKFLLKKIDETVYISRNNKAQADRQHIAQAGSIIPNGLDPNSLTFLGRDDARQFISQISGIKFNDQFVIGSIGRLSYQKNYEFLLEIFPKILRVHPRAIAVIIGLGPFKKRLKIISDKLNLSNKVFFIGELIDAAKYLNAFDLFVLPSRYEGLPITLIECLFASLPILCTNVGGNAEVLDGSVEQLYTLNDQAGFLDKITPLIKNKKFRNKLAKQNKNYSKNFRLSRMTAEYIKLYNKSKATTEQ